MGERLIAGDCLVELPKLAAAGEWFHCCVTDLAAGIAADGLRLVAGLTALTASRRAGNMSIRMGYER